MVLSPVFRHCSRCILKFFFIWIWILSGREEYVLCFVTLTDPGLNFPFARDFAISPAGGVCLCSHWVLTKYLFNKWCVVQKITQLTWKLRVLRHFQNWLLPIPVSPSYQVFQWRRWPWMNRDGFAVTGVCDVRGCGRALQPGRVAMPGPCAESLVPRGDAGELQLPGVSGWGGLPLMKNLWKT